MKKDKMKWVNEDAAQINRMREKVAAPEGKAIYRRRKTIVEPVFGHIKGPFGLRKLLLGGVRGAKIEVLVACPAHKLCKMGRVCQINIAKGPGQKRRSVRQKA